MFFFTVILLDNVSVSTHFGHVQGSDESIGEAIIHCIVSHYTPYEHLYNTRLSHAIGHSLTYFPVMSIKIYVEEKSIPSLGWKFIKCMCEANIHRNTVEVSSPVHLPRYV